MSKKDLIHPKVWVATVDMGLGHQRATYPFRDIAEGEIINVNSSHYARKGELFFWRRLRRGYECFSRAKSIPLLGNPLFSILDSLQHIPSIYPVRDMSHLNLQVRMLNRVIKRGLCAGMLETIQKKPLPLLTSYMTPAIAADRAGHEKIYCIVCDAEVHRAWVAEDPKKSRIQYFAPCEKSVRRLKNYGVPDEKIFLTGFPLPLELLGDKELHVLKGDLIKRLQRLDPQGIFRAVHRRSLLHVLKKEIPTRGSGRKTLTLTFAVGGAGAQRETGFEIAKSVREKLKRGEMILNLVAGVRDEVKAYFKRVKSDLLPDCPHLRVVTDHTKDGYFDQFSQVLRETDILWTKPSELSFYAGLGIPLILAPTIGSHEEYNKKWLTEIHAAFPQEDPRYTDEWLFDMLMDTRFAECAWDGFMRVRKHGLFRILEVLKTGSLSQDLPSESPDI